MYQAAQAEMRAAAPEVQLRVMEQVPLDVRCHHKKAGINVHSRVARILERMRMVQSLGSTAHAQV